MKKVVLKLDIHDDSSRTEALRMISSFTGIRSMFMDEMNREITLTGDIDPVNIGKKLRQLCPTDILTVLTAQEPESSEKKNPKKQSPNDCSFL